MSHARCEDISDRLRKVAFKAAAYHAGLGAAERAKVQQAYFAGALDVVVATSAFGMGIDKPDVRTVVHAGVPASLDEYYQEIGRAGRDRQPAQAVLVYDPRTLRIPRLFAARSRIPTAHVGAVLAALIASPTPVAVTELVHASAVSRPTVERVVAELEELGFASIENDMIVTVDRLANARTEIDDAGKRRQVILGARIDSVRHFAETVNCRRAELLAYFGEAIDPPCHNCDNDDLAAASAGNEAANPGDRPHAATTGIPVVHRLWGPGVLLSRDEHELLVSFESVGYRHLSPSALANGLLTFATV
jgi:ATP-dependent DNA helicase RecQ